MVLLGQKPLTHTHLKAAAKPDCKPAQLGRLIREKSSFLASAQKVSLALLKIKTQGIKHMYHNMLKIVLHGNMSTKSKYLKLQK